MKPVVRPARIRDQESLIKFLEKKNLYIHHHLDWRKPMEWLGSSPFLVLENEGDIEAIFVCPPDIHGIYWLRLFAAKSLNSMEDDFSLLFSNVLAAIKLFSPEGIVASIGYLDWMKHILLRNGFEHYQEVVQLKWDPNHQIGTIPALPEDGLIRSMQSNEIEEITRIDQACFEKIWMHSLPAVEKAYQQSAYSTIALVNNKIVGFQISTKYLNRPHIARLAVLPDYQKTGFGTALIMNVLDHFRKPWIREITVNTQQDNTSSLRLYKKLGFCLTGESFPILIYQI